MASWKPVDVDLDGTGDEEYEWDDYVVNDLEERFQGKFNRSSNRSYNKDIIRYDNEC